MACWKGQHETVEILVKAGANINATDSQGYTPLSRACAKKNRMQNRLKIIELLLKHGADPTRADYHRRRTPLHLACQWNRPKVAKLLLQYGGPRLLEAKGYDNSNIIVCPLELAPLSLTYEILSERPYLLLNYIPGLRVPNPNKY